MIGAYKIGPQLNSGGMGMVFQAQKVLENGRAINVAIKFPRLAVVHDEEILQGFFNEAETMSKFRCSRIPKIDSWGVHEGLPYVVMDLLTGVSLQEFLNELSKKKRQLDFDLAAHVFREVALALHYAHTFVYAGRPMNVLHRDMAAKNVVIDKSGDVYLIDFGVVRSEDTLLNGASSASIVKGTLNYLAPEHAAGDPCAASDVFGLHAILWEMLEGRTFRSGLGERQLWGEVMRGSVPPLTRTNVPGFLRTLIERGLHPDPEERIKLSDALKLLEEHSKPRNTALKALFARHFEYLARRSGSTIVDEGFEVPSELFKTMAAAKAVHNPLGAPKLDLEDVPPDPEPDPQAEPSADLPTVKRSRPPTAPGLPLALRREEDERPPQPNRPTPAPSTEILHAPGEDITRVDHHDERGYTVPLMEAIGVAPASTDRLATQQLPTPPEIAGSPSEIAEEPARERPLPRWPLVALGVVVTGLLAVVTAFVVIGQTTKPEPVTSSSHEPAPSEPHRAPRPAKPSKQEPEPTPPLEIPQRSAQPDRAPPAPAQTEAAPPQDLPEPEVDPEVDPEPKPTPQSRPPIGTSKLTLRAGFSRAEVQIRRKTIDLSSTKTLRVRAGSVTVRWRFPPSQTWSHKTLQIERGHAYVIQVEKSGLRVVESRR